MPTPQELEAQFWKSLKSDMTMMLGLVGVDQSHARPMTAQIEGERGPIWFFTAIDTGIVEALKESSRAFATYAAKGRDLFATLARSNLLPLWEKVSPKATDEGS